MNEYYKEDVLNVKEHQVVIIKNHEHDKAIGSITMSEDEMIDFTNGKGQFVPEFIKQNGEYNTLVCISLDTDRNNYF